MKWGFVPPLAAVALAADAPLEAPTRPCWRDVGDVIVSVPYRECVDLLPPERFRGTWFVALEESGFLPAEAPLPAVRVVTMSEHPPENDTHLDVGWPETLELLERVPEPEGEGDTRRYAVEFIGRRARHAGAYGHGGVASRLIVVDRMLSIRPAGTVTTRIEFPGLQCNLRDCPDSYPPSTPAGPGELGRGGEIGAGRRGS